MGVTSWNTSDTKKSIRLIGSKGGTFPVYMLTGDDVFEEYEYDGYQSFGGKNFYVATFEMNVKSLGLSTVLNIYNRANIIFERFVPSTTMEQLSYEDKRTVWNT